MADADGLDVGISGRDVADLLQRSPVVSIIGYQRSGKSKLAEILQRDLGGERNVVMQAASSWSHGRATDGSGDASVDPEIVHVLEQVDRGAGDHWWIIDDAEVMLAYATDAVLASLREQLQSDRFRLVLIRNRFVREGEGWFQQREAALAANIPTLTMRPMLGKVALDAAIAMFQGPYRSWQGEWLASMSGGVPGLMADLYRYTPNWPQSPADGLIAFARQKWIELELDRPMRRLIVQRLLENTLPPPALLSEQARNEIGVLLLAGMVSSGYLVSPDPFQARFWRWLCASGDQERPYAVDEELQNTAMMLELMIADSDLLDAVKQVCGIPGSETGVLARAIERSLYCERHFPGLVRPFRRVLTEALGRYGLLQLLRTHRVVPEGDLVDALFAIARG